MGRADYALVDLKEAVKAARYLAFVVGTVHARQPDAPIRAEWRKTLLDQRTAAIDAPSWLWDAVVDLSGSHKKRLSRALPPLCDRRGGMKAPKSGDEWMKRTIVGGFAVR